MHYVLLIYFKNKPLHVSSRLAAHHQEEQLSMTIPIVVCTELILLMMSSKPVRNM